MPTSIYLLIIRWKTVEQKVIISANVEPNITKKYAIFLWGPSR